MLKNIKSKLVRRRPGPSRLIAHTTFAAARRAPHPTTRHPIRPRQKIRRTPTFSPPGCRGAAARAACARDAGPARLYAHAAGTGRSLTIQPPPEYLALGLALVSGTSELPCVALASLSRRTSRTAINPLPAPPPPRRPPLSGPPPPCLRRRSLRDRRAAPGRQRGRALAHAPTRRRLSRCRASRTRRLASVRVCLFGSCGCARCRWTFPSRRRRATRRSSG